MSKNVSLKAEVRDGTGKGVARKLRATGRVPANVYGGGEDARALSLDSHDTLVLFKRISVENTIVSLDIEGGETADTLVREVQVHPFRETIIHVDFQRMQKGVAIDVEVPLHLTGTPESVRTGAGVLDQIMHDISVRCIPSMIPEVIEVDISGMEVGDSIHASDIQVPKGVELNVDGALTLCSVNQPRVEAEPVDEDEDGELEDGAEAPADAAEDSESSDD